MKKIQTVHEMKSKFLLRWNIPEVGIDENDEFNDIKLRLSTFLHSLHHGFTQTEMEDGGTHDMEYDLIIDETQLLLYYPQVC